ncbi:MAG: PilZ domain-containing protein [Anaerolineales bacterium]|nr:PilZ domain-containing protein [Anaerolineales bacterium]
MDERRKLKRRHIMFYSRVFDRKTGKLLGYLGDITIVGIMIISEEPLQTGVQLKLRIDLPDYIYHKSVLNFEAQSLWCQPDIDPNFHNTGFKMLNISKDDREVIEQILRDYEIGK